jgi:SAM-dependent methyltransferase
LRRLDPTLQAWLEASAGPDEVFVDELWRSVLRRPAEPEMLDETVGRLRAGMSRSALVAELAGSAEFERVRLLDDAVAWASAQRAGGERPRNLVAPPGTDERPIEIPWCLARHRGEPRVLDIGYAFAEPAYLAALAALGARGLVGVDLVTTEVPGLESVTADLRSLPFDDGAFDVVIAISTLEHVGRDNSQYGLEVQQDDGSVDAALRQLHRVLTDDGRLLVTVPTGAADELRPEQAVLAPASWVSLFETAGFLVWEDELYELGPEGWRSVTELTPARYGERGPGATAVLCAELRPARLGARLRLAVRDRRHADEPRRAV